MTMKKYLSYLMISYIVAIIFEMNANFFFDGTLFQVPLWPIVFFVWYGLLYSVMYFIFKNRPLTVTVISGSIVGVIVEITIFHRFHIIDFVIYAIMFLIPFWTYKKYLRNKFS